MIALIIVDLIPRLGITGTFTGKIPCLHTDFDDSTTMIIVVVIHTRLAYSGIYS